MCTVRGGQKAPLYYFVCYYTRVRAYVCVCVCVCVLVCVCVCEFMHVVTWWYTAPVKIASRTYSYMYVMIVFGALFIAQVCNDILRYERSVIFSDSTVLPNSRKSICNKVVVVTYLQLSFRLISNPDMNTLTFFPNTRWRNWNSKCVFEFRAGIADNKIDGIILPVIIIKIDLNKKEILIRTQKCLRPSCAFIP
jgi:hypothetical protein